MSLPLHEYILYGALAVALALLIVRLAVSGLAGRYKFFFSYILVDFIQTTAVLFIPFRSSFYVYFFLVTESIILCLYALIVFELYGVIFRDLKGIAQLARRYILIALGVSIALAFVLRSALPKPRRLIEQFFYFEIPVIITLVLFVLLLTLFLVYYPVPIHRNGLVYVAGYAVYFLTKSALLFLSNAGSSAFIRSCSFASSVIALACILFWTITLRRDGECRNRLAARWRDPGTGPQILGQLQSLNAILLRGRSRQ